MFDHILDLDEANKHITPALQQGSELNADYKKRLFCFYHLFDDYFKVNYQSLGYDENIQDDTFNLFKIDNHDYKNICELSFSERELMKVLIPELGLILCGGYDFTNTIFVNQDFDLDVILQKVEQSQLFLID